MKKSMIPQIATGIDVGAKAGHVSFMCEGLCTTEIGLISGIVAGLRNRSIEMFSDEFGEQLLTVARESVPRLEESAREVVSGDVGEPEIESGRGPITSVINEALEDNLVANDGAPVGISHFADGLFKLCDAIQCLSHLLLKLDDSSLGSVHKGDAQGNAPKQSTQRNP